MWLPRGSAMSSSAWQSASVIGPAAGGLIYAAHPTSVYVFAVASLAVSAFTLSRVRPVQPPPPEVRRHPLREMIDGLHFVWTERFLLGTITLDLFAVLLAGATAMLPVYARDILHVGSEGLRSEEHTSELQSLMRNSYAVF